jgi:heme o synthase
MKHLSIIKPGIIFGNIVTVSGGFLMGSIYPINWLLWLYTVIGMSLVVASGCVLNNYIDRDIDRLMERTCDRLFAQGKLSFRVAMVYGVIFGLVGLTLLALLANVLTMLVALVGLIFYVGVYTLWSKRTTIYGTITGGVAGAIPPVVGYAAVTNHFDAGAWILFAILFCWQIPHFYAIAIFRQSDYHAADIPVLPVKKGMLYTKINMLLYTIAFTLAAVLPTVFGFEGFTYLVIALSLSLAWLWLAITGFKAKDDTRWAKEMFVFSILIITALSFAMAIK